MSVERHVGMMSTRERSDSSTRALCGDPTSRAIYQKIRRIWAKKMMDLVHEISLSYFVEFFNVP
jgi:hypothetical protein